MTIVDYLAAAERHVEDALGILHPMPDGVPARPEEHDVENACDELRDALNSIRLAKSVPPCQ